MRTPRFPRASDTIGARRTRPRARTTSEALPAAGPADGQFGGGGVTDDVLGDLAEERALRCAQNGPVPAYAWYLREFGRSAPHVAIDMVRRALHTSRGRAVLVGTAATCVALILATVTAIAARDVPAQLALGTGDTVVVNNQRTAKIPVHLLDAAGRTVDDDATGASFRGLSNDAGVMVAANGDVTCKRAGFARVDVERGRLSRVAVVQCAPVRAFFIDDALRFLTAGGPAEDVRVRGVAPDSSAVTHIVGSITVRDSDIVAIEGSRLIPRSVGSTELSITVGDETQLLPVIVHRAAASPSELQIGDVFSKRLSLAPGSEARWRVHPGLYTIWLRRPADRAALPLHLMLQSFNCVPSGADQQFFCVALAGATLTVVAPPGGDARSALESRLIVERAENYPGE